MDATTYCPIRKSIEDQGYLLTEKLFQATERLMATIGFDKARFFARRSDCQDVREKLRSCRLQLREHRQLHSC